MTLDPEDQETAETLLRHHKATKQVNCYRRQLCRVAEALDELSKAITSELEGGQSRAIVKRVNSGRFTIDPANRIAGRPITHELPTSDHLSELADGYRAACQRLEASEREVSEL